MNFAGHTHQKQHSKMVRAVLRNMADQLELPYQEIHRRFTRGDDYAIALRFWDLFYQHYPVHQALNDVSYCAGCRSFTLEIL